jgi:hypothetical protein
MQIRELLYQRRFTIAGAKRRLLDQRKEAIPQVELGFDDAGRKLALHEVKTELRRLLERLRERAPRG